MNAHIITRRKLRKDELAELAMFGVQATVATTTKKLTPHLNPYFKQVWANFNILRNDFTWPKDVAVRAYFTSEKELQSLGITSHIGMYDNLDGDRVIDFYAGLPSKLDPRAKKNGFTTNVAWLFVHESCHGFERLNTMHDRTHAMEEQGRLQELWHEHMHEIPELKRKLSLYQQILELMKKLHVLKTPTLYQAALSYLGKDASPRNLAPQELACAESVSTIIREVISDFPVTTGTWTLKQVLDSHPRFKPVTIPMPGTILMYASGTLANAPYPGHVLIFGEGELLMSNTSKNGKWEQNYTLTSARKRWRDVGFPEFMYQLIN